MKGLLENLLSRKTFSHNVVLTTLREWFPSVLSRFGTGSFCFVLSSLVPLPTTFQLLNKVYHKKRRITYIWGICPSPRKPNYYQVETHLAILLWWLLYETNLCLADFVLEASAYSTLIPLHTTLQYVMAMLYISVVGVAIYSVVDYCTSMVFFFAKQIWYRKLLVYSLVPIPTAFQLLMAMLVPFSV